MKLNHWYFIIVLFFLNQTVLALDMDWVDRILTTDLLAIKEELKSLQKELKKDEENSNLLAQIAICYHIMAENGDNVSKKAIEYFGKSLKINEDFFVRSYLGSAYTLLGGEKSDLSLLYKGFDLIDNALIDSHQDVNIVILRITNSLSLPDFIFTRGKESRKDLVINDLKYINNLIQNGNIEKIRVDKIRYFESILLLKEEKLDEAINQWKNILTEYPDSEVCKTVKVLLNKYNSN